MNPWDILILALLLLLLFLAFRRMRRTRKTGGCPCSCSDCPGSTCPARRTPGT